MSEKVEATNALSVDASVEDLLLELMRIDSTTGREGRREAADAVAVIFVRAKL